LINKENATAEEIIEAAIKFGDGDKRKTVNGFETVFSEVDTLRNKKALAMYDQLLEEKERTGASGGKIDFGAIFSSAKDLGSKVEKESEKEREVKLEILRKEKAEAERKQKEAMVIQQKALEEEMKEKLAAAISKDEVRKELEGKKKRDDVYYAIFDSNGNSETAIKNLIKTYPKGDAYAEKKAKALYAEYEKYRLTGTTLSKMDFGKLFQAADKAEQQAIKEDIDKDNIKQASPLEELKKRIAEKKLRQQAQVTNKIIAGLKDAPKDRASQIAVFKEALPKNETRKDEKAEAMYEEYIQQQQIVSEIEQGLKTVSKERSAQLAVFFNALPEETTNREAKAEKMYDTYVKNQNQGGSGKVSMDFGSLFEAADVAETKSKLADKEKLRKEELAAQDQLDARREDIRKEKQTITKQVEKDMEKVHSENATSVQTKKVAQMKQAFESGAGDRDNTVRAIMKTLPQTGDKELDRDRAEAVYDAYLEERKAKQSGSSNTPIDYGGLFKAADNAELAKLQRQNDAKLLKQEIKNKQYEETRTERLTDIAVEEQKKAVKDAERAEVDLENTMHKVEVQRQERLTEEKKIEEQREKTLAMEQASRLAKEDERKEEELAILRKDQEERLARDGKEAELVALRKKRELEEQDRLAQKEADRLLVEAEKQQLLAEAAAQKAKEEREKEEAKRLTDIAKAQKNKELAEARAEEQRVRDEEKRIADAAKEKKLADIAAVKAVEEVKRKEEQRLAALSKKQAEDAERKRQADYDKLISEGDLAITKSDYKKGWQNYKDALALYPDNKDANSKFKNADTELKRIDKAAAEQLALNEKYNKLMQEGATAFEESQYDLAQKKFEDASELKPKEQDPKQQIRNLKRKVAAIELARKEDAAKERKYILLLQDGAIALEANDLALAKSKYEEAASMKPQDTEPQTKLREITELEAQIAAAELAEKQKEDAAQLAFEKKKEEAKQRAADDAAKAAKVQDARIAAIITVDDQKEEQSTSIAQQDSIRIDNYEKAKKAIAEMDLSTEDQRLEFLSQLAKIYPEGLTKETVQGKNFVLTRHVINQNNVVTIYERKAWDWGGLFHWKNSDIAITEALYNLEIGKYKE
ncbi:MAG: hypothetical protein JKX84_07400, partial [Flavobacteriales bacterium]|nr:hypothetical protein [Flavobacteriales bacterium]